MRLFCSADFANELHFTFKTHPKKGTYNKGTGCFSADPREGHETLFENRKSGMGYGYRATCEFWVHATAV